MGLGRADVAAIRRLSVILLSRIKRDLHLRLLLGQTRVKVMPRAILGAGEEAVRCAHSDPN